MTITEGKTHTISQDDPKMELQQVSRPYYLYKGSIEAWLDEPKDTWQERKLIFDTDYPVVIEGDLKARSYINTNHPLKVQGENLRGEF